MIDIKYDHYNELIKNIVVKSGIRWLIDPEREERNGDYYHKFICDRLKMERKSVDERFWISRHPIDWINYYYPSKFYKIVDNPENPCKFRWANKEQVMRLDQKSKKPN